MAYTTVNKSTAYFNTVLYTGTGSSNSISGVNFQPDWVWIKKRNAAVGHRIYDSVRGVQNTLFSDSDAAEGTGQSTTLTAFNSDGFTVISESGVNASSDTYASWNWLADNTSGSSNTDGTITSTVSANTTSGFSIVSFTGTGSNATVGHGLGTAPSMIIQKARDSVLNWKVYHKSLGATQYMNFDQTNAAATASTIWNDTEPTTSVYSLGTGNTNTSSVNYIAYCFAEKQGFSKFGSYVGNGNADGTFIYTGFKPAFVMCRRTDTIEDWGITDVKRNTFNIVDKKLRPNSSITEVTIDILDINSNGFKLRNTSGEFNASGGTYIYMAFASAPLVGSNDIPCTAR